MRSFLRENSHTVGFLILWMVVARFAPILMYGLLPLGVFLLRRVDKWQDILFGFIMVLVMSDAGPEFGHMAVFKSAKKHKKLLELNASPERLDLDDVQCAAAKEHGVPIVISTDAHSPDGLHAMRLGVLQARRAGLTKKDVANTRTLAQFQKLLH